MPNQTERKRFLQLVEKYISGTATNSEKAFLEEYYQQHESRPEWLDGLTNDQKISLSADLKDAIYARISRADSGKEEQTLIVYFRKHKVALTAAAMLVMILGTSFIYLFNRSSVHQQTPFQASTNRFKDDVVPGHDGAILTLADGKSIVLDSVHNGSLAIQGSAEVIKKDGQVVYNKINNPYEVTYNTVHTPNGRQYSLRLADGSKVWLNAASSITFPTSFSGSQRKVSVTGEVYFEVADNSRMPFVVQKDGLNVNVLGTHFNINSYDDENSINVTLLEGAVKVITPKGDNIIKPGQQARVIERGPVSVVNDVDMEEVMAWRNEVFKFKSIEIGSLMRQLARWYDVEVVYNKKVNDRFFIEVPRNTNLSDLLKALELTGRIKFKIEGKKIIVMP